MNRSEAGKLGAAKSAEKARQQKEERIIAYNLNPKKCIVCNGAIDYGRDRRTKYCSHACAAKITNHERRKIRYCLHCKKETKNKEYCDHECHLQYQQNEFIVRWKNGQEGGLNGGLTISPYIRYYMFKKNDSKCSLCGWSVVNIHTGKIPLEIDHIDGNYKNNKEENLRLICPNCHSLTSTYKGANQGKNKENRDRKKYKSRY